MVKVKSPFTSCGKLLRNIPCAEIPTSAHPTPYNYSRTGAWGLLCKDPFLTMGWDKTCGYITERWPYWLYLCKDCCKRNGLLW